MQKDNSNSSFKNNLGLIVGIIATIATLMGLYLQFKQDRIEIDIKTLSQDNLSEFTQVSNLNFNLSFNEKPITNLWRASFFVENVGNKTVIGSGSKTDLITNSLSIKTAKNFQFLDLVIDEKDLPLNLVRIDSVNYRINFLQWKPRESIKITAFFEKIDTLNSLPSILFDEREIINSSINYSQLSSSNNPDKRLIDYLPLFLQSPIKIIGFLGITFLIFLSVTYLYVELKAISDFNKWKLNNSITYDEWLSQLINDGYINKKVAPENLPSNLWGVYPGEKPSLVDLTHKPKIAFLWFILFLVISTYPFLMIVRL
jgi:hypothetical protein